MIESGDRSIACFTPPFSGTWRLVIRWNVRVPLAKSFRPLRFQISRVKLRGQPDELNSHSIRFSSVPGFGFRAGGLKAVRALLRFPEHPCSPGTSCASRTDHPITGRLPVSQPVPMPVPSFSTRAAASMQFSIRRGAGVILPQTRPPWPSRVRRSMASIRSVSIRCLRNGIIIMGAAYQN